MEEKITESAEKFREIFENARDVIALLDLSGRFIDINKRVEEIGGWKREELIGKHFWETGILLPEDIPKYLGLIREFTRSGKYWEFLEIPVRKKNGEIIMVEASTRVLKRNNKPYGLLSIARDITERKKMEKALKESETRYRTLVESAQEGIGIVDPQENILCVNQTFGEILGYKPDELVGKNLRELTDDTEFHKYRKETEKRKQGEKSRYETFLYHKNSEPRYLSVSAAPLWDDEENFVGTIGVVIDITERKKMEKELKEKVKELEEAYNKLREKSERLERFHKLTVGRELEMVKLKEEINSLCEKLGMPKKYRALEKTEK